MENLKMDEELRDDVNDFIDLRVDRAFGSSSYKEARKESSVLWHQLRELIKDNAEAVQLLSDYESAENVCAVAVSSVAYKQGFNDALKLFKEVTEGEYNGKHEKRR
jgi:hypothetical protein